MFEKYILCRSCGHTYPLKTILFRCSSCEGSLEVVLDEPRIAQTIHQKLHTRVFGHVRYKELFPVKQLVSLDEGGTSLIRAKRLEKEYNLGCKLFFKYEIEIAENIAERNAYQKTCCQCQTGSTKRGTDSREGRRITIEKKRYGLNKTFLNKVHSPYRFALGVKSCFPSSLNSPISFCASSPVSQADRACALSYFTFWQCFGLTGMTLSRQEFLMLKLGGSRVPVGRPLS